MNHPLRNEDCGRIEPQDPAGDPSLQAPPSVDQQLSDIVKELAAENPELKLSYGYIGNLERWGDDRGFRIFTNRRDDIGRSISYHLGGVSDLPIALERIRHGSLDNWLSFAKTYGKAY